MSKKTKKTSMRLINPSGRPTEALERFRGNFAIALEWSGLSLRKFAEEICMTVAHASRLRSGDAGPEGFRYVVPGLDMAEQIAQGFDLTLIDMLSSHEVLVEELRRRKPEWQPSSAHHPTAIETLKKVDPLWFPEKNGAKAKRRDISDKSGK